MAIDARHASVVHGGSRIHHLHASDGRVRAGKPDAALSPLGPGILRDATGDTTRFRLQRARIGDMDLVVGLDGAENARFQQLIYRDDALGDIKARVIGLKAVVDGCIGKTFVSAELIARVAAPGRRPATAERAVRTVFLVDELELDRPYAEKLRHTVRGRGYCLSNDPDP